MLRCICKCIRIYFELILNYLEIQGFKVGLNSGDLSGPCLFVSDDLIMMHNLYTQKKKFSQYRHCVQ